MTKTRKISEEFLIQAACYAAVSISIILVISKLIAWKITASYSLKASMLDSLLDFLASTVNLLIVRQALKPADDNHRFGHGKAEALAGLAQAVFISGTTLWLLIDITHQLISPNEMVTSHKANAIMFMAIGLTIILILFQRFVIHKTNSIAIKADYLHYKGDLYSNLAVIASFNLSTYFDMGRIDAVIAALIVGYILYTAGQIAIQSLHVLMDHELPEEKRALIWQIVTSHEKVLGMHDLRTRTSGRHDFIQLHLDLPENLSLKDAHQIADEVEHLILKEFPDSEVLIHEDPISEKEEN